MKFHIKFCLQILLNHQVDIAQWLAWSVASGEVRVRIPARESQFSDKFQYHSLNLSSILHASFVVYVLFLRTVLERGKVRSQPFPEQKFQHPLNYSFLSILGWGRAQFKENYSRFHYLCPEGVCICCLTRPSFLLGPFTLIKLLTSQWGTLFIKMRSYLLQV